MSDRTTTPLKITVIIAAIAGVCVLLGAVSMRLLRI